MCNTADRFRREAERLERLATVARRDGDPRFADELADIAQEYHEAADQVEAKCQAHL